MMAWAYYEEGKAAHWMRHDLDAVAVMKKFWANTDALLFGRKTWEQAALPTCSIR